MIWGDSKADLTLRLNFMKKKHVFFGPKTQFLHLLIEFLHISIHF